MKRRITCILIVVCLLLALVPQIMAEDSSIDHPADAVEFNGNYYKIYDDSMTWTEAKSKCEELGGRLVTITSQSEMDFLIQELGVAQKNCYWIGVEYLLQEGRWQLVTGTSAPYFNWAPNEPNFENSSETYVHLFGKRYTGGHGTKEVGHWNDASNDGAGYANDFYALHNFGYICEWGTEAVASIDDLVEFNGHYYKIYHHTETWEDARDYCVSVGGHLATITSQEENDFLYQFIKERSVTNTYFGLSDAEEEGTWKWVTDEPMEYTNWGGSEPNAERSNEDYGMFYYKYTTGGWNDGNFGQGTAGDNFPVHFICEWEDKPSSDDLLVKFYPTGYDFQEDSYSFDNNEASGKIKEKYFTTLFEPAAGKELAKQHKGAGSGGVCFGMTYTTAAILNGYPVADSFVTEHFWTDDEDCRIVRDLTLKSKTIIGKNEIAVQDYIRYAHIYQYSSTVQNHRNQTQEHIDELFNQVRAALDADQIGVAIDMFHFFDNNGTWENDHGHTVLAVGIDGNDILIDDPNNTDTVERLAINDDGSWTFSGYGSYSFSGSWTDGSTENSILCYNTDVTMPYHTLYTGTNAVATTDSAVGLYTSNEEESSDIFIEGMERLDSDKMLLSIESDGYQLSNADAVRIFSPELNESTDTFWISNGSVVALNDVVSSNSVVHLASDDLLLGVETNGNANISMTNDGAVSSVKLDAEAGEVCTLSLETTGTDTQDVVLTISGTASNGTVTMNHTDSRIDFTGLDDCVITLTEDEKVVVEKQIPDSDDDIQVEYDPDGNEDDVEISFTNPFSDVLEDSFYYEPVMWAVENGITSGTSKTTFDPSGLCLRAHVVTFLYRAAGSPVPSSTKNPFADAKSGDFYYNPVLWAVGNGITQGISKTQFGSTQVCNRAAVVTFLWRAFGSPEPKSMNNPFVDVKNTDFFYKPVLWAVENGITAGIDATHFNPTGACNRAQVVTFLYRAYN